MSAFAGGLLSFGGAALSALGGNAPGRDVRRERDTFYQTQGKSQWEQLQAQYGSDADLAYLASSIGPEWRQYGTDPGALDRAIAAIAPNRTRADLERFVQQNPGYNAQQNALINAVSNRQTADLGYFDQQTQGIRNQINADNSNLMNSYANIGGRMAQGYNQATAAATGTYRNYGKDTEKQIQQDLALAQKSALARSMAAGARRGGMNTNDQMVLAGTQAANMQAANRSINDVRSTAAQLTGGALERGMNAKNSALGNLWGAQLQMEQGRAAASEGFNSNALSARMGLENAYLSNDQAMRTSLNNTNLNLSNDIANAQRMQPIQYHTDPNPVLPQIGAQIFGAGSTMLGDWYASGRPTTPANPYQSSQMNQMRSSFGG